MIVGVGAAAVPPPLPPVVVVLMVLLLLLLLLSIAAASAETPCKRLSVSWCDASEEEEEIPPPEEKGRREVEEVVDEVGLLGREASSPERDAVVPPGEEGGFETGLCGPLLLLLLLLLVVVVLSPVSRTLGGARVAPARGLLGRWVISGVCMIDWDWVEGWLEVVLSCCWQIQRPW